jgi:hypothetical protein
VVVGQFDCGSITGLNRAAVDTYPRDGTRLVCTTIDPRRIRLVAGLRQGCGAPPNPGRTQRTTNQTRVHTGIVGRTSTNERWQAEDCGRRMTDKQPKRPGTPTSSQNRFTHRPTPANPGLTSGLPRVVQGLSGDVVAGDLRGQDAEQVAREAQQQGDRIDRQRQPAAKPVARRPAPAAGCRRIC